MISESQNTVDRLVDVPGAQLDRQRLQLLLASARTRVVHMKQLHAERQSAYDKRLMQWQQLQTNMHSVQTFVDNTDRVLSEWRTRNRSPDLDEMERVQEVHSTLSNMVVITIFRIWNDELLIILHYSMNANMNQIQFYHHLMISKRILYVIDLMDYNESWTH